MSVPLTTSGNKAIDDYVELFNDSIAYTKKCREKAKKLVQEKRKTDKSYAHTKKRSSNGHSNIYYLRNSTRL